MTTHVFIVDSTTFKLHLEYLFAGTGAKEHEIDFNNGLRTRLHQATENMLIGMMADACRIRRGDQIIFYLQQNISGRIYEGKFYGIFRACDDWSFLDNNDQVQYLRSDLGKSLTFRTLIEPYKVYAEGVTEWEALDEIKNLTSPNQMLWSLIYRKLKGNRGNTMITIYEAERLTQLIRTKNNRMELDCQNKLLSFDATAQKIVCLNRQPNIYAGRKEDIEILPRLAAKYRAGNSFESHLQAYIMKNINKGTNTSLDKTVLDGAQLEWLGNEVPCGVGMQRIDIMPSVVHNEQRVLIPIELKAVEADEKNVTQIQRYVDWIEQYYIPNRQSDIQPILVARKTENKQSIGYRRLIESIRRFNQVNGKRCEDLKYVEFFLNGMDLLFERVEYI
jgi:hypothetical protein